MVYSLTICPSAGRHCTCVPVVWSVQLHIQSVLVAIIYKEGYLVCFHTVQVAVSETDALAQSTTGCRYLTYHVGFVCSKDMEWLDLLVALISPFTKNFFQYWTGPLSSSFFCSREGSMSLRWFSKSAKLTCERWEQLSHFKRLVLIQSFYSFSSSWNK